MTFFQNFLVYILQWTFFFVGIVQYKLVIETKKSCIKIHFFFFLVIVSSYLAIHTLELPFHN